MTYIGKDVIHYGCGLDLDPELVLGKIDRSARKNIRKAESAGIEIRKRAPTSELLAGLRRLWYLPDDPNFPERLGCDDLLYVAHLQDELVGGMILIRVGSHLFLNNLLASETGKRHQVQGHLLWRAVNDLKDSRYTYIDIGVSYRPNLYRFFKKWATFTYPVIFNPPPIKPALRFTPFVTLPDTSAAAIDDERIARFCLGRPYTIVPSLSYAMQIAADRGLGFRRVAMPQAACVEVQVVNLPELLPIPYGAILIGCELRPEELWDRYGCYDEFKTDYIKKCFSNPATDLPAICEKRRAVFGCYAGYFKHEDVKTLLSSDPCTAFALRVDKAEALAERYDTFGVEVRLDGDVLRLPCHQNLSPADVEYVYAIYRGYLNLCSEWVPTHVKGRLKVKGPPRTPYRRRTGVLSVSEVMKDCP